MIGIYRYTNLINGKRYIGQSVDIENRYKSHLQSANNNPNTLIDKAIHKYGIENFKFEIIEFCNREELNDLEKYWIDYYCCNIKRKDNLGYGYNLNEGGNSFTPWNKGITLTNEYKNKISESCKHYCGDKHSQFGTHKSNITKQKLRDKNIGKKQSLETIQKRVNKLIGQKRSDEFKNSISLNKRNRIPIYKDDKQKYIISSEYDYYINNGWKHGLNPIIVKKREETRKYT